MILSDVAIRRPVFAWMIMAALMIFGLISYFRLGVSQLPNVDFPVVEVRLTWTGAAPEVMEKDVVDPVEQALMTVQGAREVSSRIRQGTASVSVELDLGRDIDDAVSDIQTKLSQTQRLLPKDIDPPVISRQNPNDQPIMFIAVTSTRSRQELMAYVDKHLKDRFSGITGVGEVLLRGFVEPNLRVWVNNDRLNAYELTVSDVKAAIARGHVELPAGQIETPAREQNLRVMAEAATPEEFGDILITTRAGQTVHTPVRLRNVARIEDGLADIRRISRFKGVPSVGLGIKKQTGANDVAIAHAVLKRLEEVKKTLPADIQMQVALDRTRFIEDTIHDLTFTLILSAVITSLVCWLFLGAWSATLNILLAIPTSLLGTFIVIYFFGFTLNTFTILGLSLAVGIVVDDAIMVLENIVRFRENGADRLSAAARGASQIAGAATAATLAIIAIFIPVVFISGVMGKFFYEFGVTISVAVALSLLEALMLTPMRCSQFLQSGHGAGWGQAVDRWFRGLAEGYARWLKVALRWSWLVILGSFTAFALSLLIVKTMRKEFVPPQDQSMFMVSLQAPPGASINFTNERFQEAEKYVASRPEVTRYFAAVGGLDGGEVNRGNLFITFKSPLERDIDPKLGRRPTQADLMEIFREDLGKVEGLRPRIQDLSLSGFSAQRGFPVEFSVRGPDWERLIEFSDRIQERMEASGLMVDVDSDYKPGAREIRVVPDRQSAEAYAVSMEAIAQAVNALYGGEVVGKFSRADRRYDIRIRLEAGQRISVESIGGIYVWNNRGERVPLSRVVRITEKDTAQSITRRARERAISVYANVARGRSQTEALDLSHRIASEVLPEGYTVVFGGSTQTFQDSFQGIRMIFVMGIMVAYMVLASQYNSFLQPLIVLLALPFSITGALVALKLGNQSINLYSVIGVILLMGIVKKNSILLVDLTGQMRREGLKVSDALLTACPVRLRPILMTSLATIAAAIPPAVAVGSGAEVRAPMAFAVIGGVALSTFFTLFVVPCVYSLVIRDGKKETDVSLPASP